MISACESVLTESGRMCDQCGAPNAAPSRYCSACGSEILMFQPGEIIDGKYEILGKVAEGGMGEVYRARHLHLDEVRIIKVMKTLGGDDASSQRRFSEEARLATQVRHPNVAALYDFSKLPSGASYMVWEFIDGETLLHRLRRAGRLSPEEAIDIGIQVLSGLGEIHRTGVVHRDVSPDNIMIVARGGRRVAKIIDLGIAKRIAQDRAGMTATGMFLGKLKYCSPEQAGALAAGETLDGRSDLCSFGAVLYEMLSGRPLFESPDAGGLHRQAPAEDTAGPSPRRSAQRDRIPAVGNRRPGVAKRPGPAFSVGGGVFGRARRPPSRHRDDADGSAPPPPTTIRRCRSRLRPPGRRSSGRGAVPRAPSRSARRPRVFSWGRSRSDTPGDPRAGRCRGKRLRRRDPPRASLPPFRRRRPRRRNGLQRLPS